MQNNTPNKPGICCSLKELLDEARAVRNTLHLRRKSRAMRVGSRRAGVRGRGMEFHESRLYVTPDEIKNINWKVSARFNNLFTKVFIEEKDRPVLLALDFRGHLYFGSKNYFKSVLAAKIAARLAQASLNGGDPVGAILFDDHGIAQSKNGRRRKDLAMLLGLLAEYTQKSPDQSHFPQDTFWSVMLRHLYYRVAKGSAVFIISDFAALDPSAHSWLHRLRKRADVFALTLSDPLEEHIPRGGVLGMSYGYEKLYFDSSKPQFQEAYGAYYKQERERKAQIFLSLDIPELSFSTADNLDERLAKLFNGHW